MWERISWVCLTVVSVFTFTTAGFGVNNGVCLRRKWERPGDIKFLVIAGIRENQNGTCGNTSRPIFEQVVALEWIISLLEGNGKTVDSYIPDIVIGKYAPSSHIVLYYFRSYALCENGQAPIYIGSGWEPE